MDYFPKERKDWAYKRLLDSLKARAKKLDIITIDPTEENRKRVERRGQEEHAHGGKETREKAAADHTITKSASSLLSLEGEAKEKIPHSGTKAQTNKPVWLPYGIGTGVILILIAIFWLGSLVIDSITPINPPAVEPATQVSALSEPTEEPAKELDVGSTMISEKDGMVMVYVPAGEFEMGIDVEVAIAECEKDISECQPEWFSNNTPVHTVYLDAFWIDQTEVTNDMYTEFLNVEGNQSEGGVTWLEEVGEITKVGNTWLANGSYEYHPVVGASWYGAQAYCEWVGRRLPTEAEWEKAAGWDDEKKRKYMYPWGNYSLDCSLANGITEYGPCIDDTARVGSYKSGKSNYEVFDMVGNVWEWVADWYGDEYYSNSPLSNPSGPESGDYRVLRGGSWIAYYPFYNSTFYRFAETPSFANSDIGFRCAMSASE